MSGRSAVDVIAEVLRANGVQHPIYGKPTDYELADLAAEIDAALGGLTRETRIPPDCDCGNESHASWCDDDCVRFDKTKTEFRWAGGWTEETP